MRKFVLPLVLVSVCLVLTGCLRGITLIIPPAPQNLNYNATAQILSWSVVVMSGPPSHMVDYEVSIFHEVHNTPPSGVRTPLHTFWTYGATSVRLDLCGDDKLLFLFTGTIDGEQIDMGEYTQLEPRSYLVEVRTHGNGEIASITANFSGVVRIDG